MSTGSSKFASFDSLTKEAITIIKAANRLDSTVLVTGATGSGKSFLARMIHESSKRGASGRYWKINLATLSENLLESELFGHERGAFTGADARRLGKLEICQGGTVFLDEIGELPLRLQAKLLDFIQFKRITPVGSNREIEVNVRIIAATNKNLEECVKRGEFREDLFHRLNVFSVALPSLVEHPRGVMHFARALLLRLSDTFEKPIYSMSPDVEAAILAYQWPGNIRELENVLEYAVAMSHSNTIEIEDLPPRFWAAHTGEMSETKVASPIIYPSQDVLSLTWDLNFHRLRDSFERAFLERALAENRGQINQTSRVTGLNKVSLSEKIKKHQIDWRQIRTENLGPVTRLGSAQPNGSSAMN